MSDDDSEAVNILLRHRTLLGQAFILSDTGHPEEALSLAKEAYEIANGAGFPTAELIKQLIQVITNEGNQGSRKGEGKVETA
jgi:hypothetical protein